MPAYSAITLLLVTWVLSYYVTIGSILEEWMGDFGPYNHGPLALVIAGFAFWRKRDLVRHVAHSPAVLEMLIIVGLAASWWLANAVNVLLVQQLSAYFLLVVSIASLFGWRRLATLAVPALIILLALPIWGPLQVPLQKLSTTVTVHFVSALGIPVLREGFQLTIPGGKFVIEEACAGLGFLLTALTLAGLYVYFNRVHGFAAFLYCLFAAGIATIANWIRVIAIVLVGNYAGMDHELVRNHITFGWILFALMYLPMFAATRFLPHNTVEAPVVPEALRNTMPESRRLSAYAITIPVILMFLPVLNMLGNSRIGAALAEQSSALIGTGHSTPDASIDWAPNFIGASSTELSRYNIDGQPILGLTVFYQKQRQGAELIGMNNELFDKSRWNEVSRKTVRNRNGDDEYVKLVLQNRAGQYRHIVYWYVIAGKSTTRPLTGKLYELYGVITGNRGSSLVAFAADSKYRAGDIDGVLDQLANRYRLDGVQSWRQDDDGHNS